MIISEAICLKIKNICKEEKISINKLANISGITQSTLNNLVHQNSNNPKLLTIVKICDGLGITLTEFFNDKLFDDLDRNLKL